MPNVQEIINTIKLDENKKQSIGTKQEKTIHQFLKYYLCSDSAKHEIKIGKHIVDVLDNNHIYEIQTQSFNTMREKLKNLLDDYQVTIVYPIMTKKVIYKINENGEVTSIRRSPKKLEPVIIGNELYKIKNFLLHPNLSFKIVLLDGIEYQTTRQDRYKRTKNTRIDQYPNDVIEIINISKSSDFEKIIPDNLGLFKATEFGKFAKLKGRKLSSCLLAFRHLGIIELVALDGKCHIYKKTK